MNLLSDELCHHYLQALGVDVWLPEALVQNDDSGLIGDEAFQEAQEVRAEGAQSSMEALPPKPSGDGVTPLQILHSNPGDQHDISTSGKSMALASSTILIKDSITSDSPRFRYCLNNSIPI